MADQLARDWISIHALREEGDYTTNNPQGQEVLFLSTPSARRATAHRVPPFQTAGNFYPRPPRGGRLHVILLRKHRKGFLSTPSARRATAAAKGMSYGKFKISIHALREEGDATGATAATTVWHFYPRPPRGGRRVTELPSFRPMIFLSTPSVRRATRLFLLTVTGQGFLSTPSVRRATTFIS